MSVTRILRRAGMAAATCVALVAASTASAGNILHTIGWANGYENFTLSNHSGAVSVGGFAGDWNGTPIDFWCIDVFHSFSLGSTYTNDYVAAPYSNPRLSELFQADLASALTGPVNVNSAAFQLAVWNIIYDNDNSVSGGTWFATGDAAAISLANSWLTSLPSSSNVQLTSLTSTADPQHQQFVTPGGPLQQVPEPSSIPLLGVGLAAMLFAIRNRKSLGTKA
jgi:hypothetical protein